MEVFTFSGLDQEYSFWANLAQQIQKYPFKLEFGT